MGSSGKKNALDKHHLFSDHYLKEQGYFSNRSSRANFTYLDYQNNIYIQDDAPADYVPRYRDCIWQGKNRHLGLRPWLMAHAVEQ